MLRSALQTGGYEKGATDHGRTLETDHVLEIQRSRPKRSTRRNLWKSAARILAITMTMLNVTAAYKNEHFGDYDNRARGEAGNTANRGIRFEPTEVVYHLDNNFERREEDLEAEKLAKDEKTTVNECIRWVLSSSWAKDEVGKIGGGRPRAPTTYVDFSHMEESWDWPKTRPRHPDLPSFSTAFYVTAFPRASTLR